MATTLQFKRYSTAVLAGITGASGELIVDTSKTTITVHDGSTAGGIPVATETFVTSAVAGLQASVSAALVSYATNATLTSNLATKATSSELNRVAWEGLSSVSQSIIPSADSVYSLGSPTRWWKDLWLSTSTLFIAGTAVTVSSGTIRIGSGTSQSTLVNTSSLSQQISQVSSDLTAYVNSSVSSALTNLGNGTGTASVANLNLGDGFLLYTGTSASTLTAAVSFSSAQISAYSSSLFIINPTPATITSIIQTVSSGTIIFGKTSNTGSSYEVSFSVDSTPTYTTGDTVTSALLQVFFSPQTITSGSTYTLSSVSTYGLLHTIRLYRSAYPQFVDLVENIGFTLSGYYVTFTTSVTSASGIIVNEVGTGPAGFSIPVTATTSASNVWGYNNIAFSELNVGYTSSTGSYDGTVAGKLVHVNPNGVQYFSDGSIVYPNGMATDSSGSVIIPYGSVIKDDLGTVVIDTATSYTTTTYVADYVSSALVGYTPGGGTTSATTYGYLTSAAIVAGQLTLDYSSTVILVDHSQDVTSIAVVNGPGGLQAATVTVILTQDSTTGNHIVTGNFKTTNGAGFNLDLTTGAVNVVTFLATNISGSTTLYGFVNSTGAI